MYKCTTYYVLQVSESIAADWWHDANRAGWHWRVIEHNDAQDLDKYEERVFDLHGPFATRQKCLVDLHQTWPMSIGKVQGVDY